MILGRNPQRALRPIFRAFAKEFLQYAKTHTKPGTHTFYSVCLDRLLTFAAIADAPLNAITGEMVSRYARHRQEVPENSVVTVNGDLRTLRRVLHLAVEWGKLDRAPAIHELPQAQGPGPRSELRGRGAVSGEGFRESPRCNDSGGRYRDAPEQRTVPAALGRCGLDSAPRIPARSDSRSPGQDARAHSEAFPSPRVRRRFYSGARRRQRPRRSNPRLCSGRGQLGTHHIRAAPARRQQSKMPSWRALSSTAGVTRSEPAPHSPAWTVSRWPV